MRRHEFDQQGTEATAISGSAFRLFAVYRLLSTVY